uniref:Uncharacterized protein n=1 Tax=Eutreptiella gymnastica TaxID=73025 RepID=A0A7S1IKV9_9EUGL
MGMDHGETIAAHDGLCPPPPPLSKYTRAPGVTTCPDFRGAVQVAAVSLKRRYASTCGQRSRLHAGHTAFRARALLHVSACLVDGEVLNRQAGNTPWLPTYIPAGHAVQSTPL